jgi:chromosome segregation ATPase
VSRLENDTESLYELITEVRSTQDDHTRRFDRAESTLNEVQSTQEDHTRRFDRVESALNEVVRRLPEPS